MSDSEKRRRWRAKLEPKGAVATPAEAAAIEVLRELEARDRDLRDARREAETLAEELAAQKLRAARLEAERDAVARLAQEATEAQRARSLACSETCAKAAREVEAVRAEREGIRDQLGVANVARQEMAAAFMALTKRVGAVEARLADVLSPLAAWGRARDVGEARAELRDADDGRGGTDNPDFGATLHTLGASGGP